MPPVTAETQIALLHKDVSFIREIVEKMEKKLELMERNYLTRVEAETLQREGEKVHNDLEFRIATLEISSIDYQKFRSSVKAVAWILGVLWALGLAIIEYYH